MHKIKFMQNTRSVSESSIPVTISEQAFQQLRHDVLRGAHLPERKLKLDELQTRYGFSSSPLREALNRLTQEGLVRSDERRGFRVAPISREDLADITRMRLMLDLPALRCAIAEGDDQWEATIVAAFHRLERVESKLSEGPTLLNETWSRLHRDFHLAVLAACTSQRQLAWSTSLFDQAERYRYFSARHRQTSRRKSDEHKRLMNAVLKRDADTACCLLEEHILSTQRHVNAALERMARDG